MKHQTYFDNDVRAVEIFRTNVQNRVQANHIISIVHQRLGYDCNFDLDDCDKILRVCALGFVKADLIVDLLTEAGFIGEMLDDDVPEREVDHSQFKKAVS